jgi:hypothetical protein
MASVLLVNFLGFLAVSFTERLFWTFSSTILLILSPKIFTSFNAMIFVYFEWFWASFLFLFTWFSNTLSFCPWQSYFWQSSYSPWRYFWVIFIFVFSPSYILFLMKDILLSKSKMEYLFLISSKCLLQLIHFAYTKFCKLSFFSVSLALVFEYVDLIIEYNFVGFFSFKFIDSFMQSQRGMI